MAEKSLGNPSSFGLVIGEVVNRKDDPTQTGQVKVRWNIGTINQSDLKEEDLPWSRTLVGSQSASLNGIGGPHTGYIEGTKVIGISLSGDGQDLIVIGSLPSAGQSEVDGQPKFDSDIPRPAKKQENNGKQQPKFGDQNGVAQEYKDQSVIQWAGDSGGPEKKPAKYQGLSDSCGSYGSSEGPDGSSNCTALA